MAIVSLVGLDTAVGTITGGGQSWVTIDGRSTASGGTRRCRGVASAMPATAVALRGDHGGGQLLGYD